MLKSQVFSFAIKWISYWSVMHGAFLGAVFWIAFLATCHWQIVVNSLHLQLEILPRCGWHRNEIYGPVAPQERDVLFDGLEES